MKTALIITVTTLVLLNLTEKGLAVNPWPAEGWTSAVTFTHLNPDFRNNMSGACWNPEKRIFWVCRNGGPSAFWALKYNGAGSLMIATNNSGTQAGYYLRSGDLEAICQVDYDTDFVFLMFEKKNLIRKYDVSVYGKPKLEMQWDISTFVPKKGGGGSEGITFVPNEWLKKEEFVNAGGKSYISTNGMGGLMFVAHQNGGKIYAFDLNPNNGTVHFVGAYNTSRSESSGLEFDRSTGLLYVWHNLGPNYLEVTKLSSQVEGKERRFTPVAEFVGPKSGNLEGIAIEFSPMKKGRCLIVDDDNQNGAALMLFKQFDPSLFLFSGNCHAYENGGSNYISYDLNGYDYKAFKQGVEWYEKIKTVLGHYHENTNAVIHQLTNMRKAGQEKIAFVIWHGRLDPFVKKQNVTPGAFIMSRSGELFWQYEQNIINVMKKIKELGFNEVQIRFGPMGPAQPLGWEKWNELYFLENWSFLVNVRNAVESVFAGSNIQRWYDLHSEGGGQTRGQNPEYNRRMWDNYVSTFGTNDTYGVSVVPCEGRISGMIDNLRGSTIEYNPSQYAIDIYGEPEAALEIVKKELRSKNEHCKPIIIQETYYNNAKQFRLLKTKAKSLNLKLRTIMQWPWEEGVKVTHYSVTYPEKYNNYIISK